MVADDQWLPPSASQILSPTDLDLIPFPAISTPLSHTQRIARAPVKCPTPCTFHIHRIECRFYAVIVECHPLPSQSSVAPVPLSNSLAPALNPVQLSLPRTDRESELSSHLLPVRMKARIHFPITSGAIVTSSYGSYSVATSICDSSNSKPTPPRFGNCCIVACRGPQLQSSRDLRD